MRHRTEAQYAADRKRSHKAKAKREQSRAYALYLAISSLARSGHDVTELRSALSMTYGLARMHLNYVMTGKYEDFT